MTSESKDKRREVISEALELNESKDEGSKIMLPMDFYLNQLENSFESWPMLDLDPDISTNFSSSRNMDGFCENIREFSNLVKGDKDEIDISTNRVFEISVVGKDLSQRQSEQHNFCTVVSMDYILKFIALYRSLERHSSEFHIWVCCLDDEVYSILSGLKLGGATLFKAAVLEDERLIKVKGERKRKEYCWTLKAPVIEYVLNNYDIDYVVYCDSDLYFFSDPSPIFEAFFGYSILLCPNKVPGWRDTVYGEFQAGLVGFRRDEMGLDGVRWWKEKCLEWCSDDPDNGEERWGDQKYLDRLSRLFLGVKVINHRGINAAPWNVLYNTEEDLLSGDSDIHIGKDRLIVWHFACLSVFNEDEFDLWRPFKLHINSRVMEKVYIPYIEELRGIMGMGFRDRKYLYDGDVQNASNYYKHNSPLDDDLKIRHEYNFCTLAGKDDLIRLLTLYRCLSEYMEDMYIWVGCLDEISYELLCKIRPQNLGIVRKEDFLGEVATSSMKEKSRLKIYLIQHIFDKFSIKSLAYIDSSLYIYSSPIRIFEELRSNPYVIVDQIDNFVPCSISRALEYPILGFNKEGASLRLLNYFRETYLLEPEGFSNYSGSENVLKDMGLPNISIIGSSVIIGSPLRINKNRRAKLRKENNSIFLGNTALLGYNFKDLVIFGEEEFDLWNIEEITLEDDVMRYIYLPYLINLKKTIKDLKEYQDVELLYAAKAEKRLMNNVRF